MVIGCGKVRIVYNGEHVDREARMSVGKIRKCASRVAVGIGASGDIGVGVVVRYVVKEVKACGL